MISKTPEILSSEILIKSSTNNSSFLLLEGDFDQRFWESRLNLSNIQLVNCTGKPNLINTLKLLKSNSRIFSILDKDFDEILGKKIIAQNLIYTDENDLEVTLLNCSMESGLSAITKIFHESTDNTSLSLLELNTGTTVSEILRKVAANYGVLRLINEEMSLRVNFDNIPILHSNFIDHITLDQNINSLNTAFILQAAKSDKSFTIVDLNRIIDSHLNNNYFSGWRLTQGHDLMKLIAFFINSNLLKKTSGHIFSSEKSLQRDLCLITHKNDLFNTDMCKKMNSQWSNLRMNLFV